MASASQHEFGDITNISCSSKARERQSGLSYTQQVSAVQTCREHAWRWGVRLVTSCLQASITAEAVDSVAVLLQLGPVGCQTRM